MNAIKISAESLKSFQHDKNVVANEPVETRQAVRIIIKKGENAEFEFWSNDVRIGSVYHDSYHKGKYTGQACMASINDSTLPEVLDYLMKVIHGNLVSRWGLVADFVTEC